MDAQELRIGNYVKIDNELLPEVRKDICVVAGIQQIRDNDFPLSGFVISVNRIKSWMTYNQFNEFINPIPLTEEWLLKFGFMHDCATPDINFWIDMITHYLELRDFRDEWYPTYCQLPEMPNERTQRCGMNAIKYAHQLQNLYFALTGTELTISEK